MGHTRYDDLADLSEALDTIRSWPDIKEKSPGTFYIKSTPFLHFHDKDGKRWADVRRGATWGPKIDIPFGAAANERRAFLAAVREYYDVTFAAPRTSGGASAGRAPSI